MSYYLRIKGKPFGPYAPEQLLDLKAKGKLNAHTEISPDKITWQVATSYDFLYKQAEQAVQTALPAAFPESASPLAQTGADQAGGQPIWYYSLDGTSGIGPVSASEIAQKIHTGELNAQSYVWKEGETAMYAKAVSEFAHFFGTASAGTTSISPNATAWTSSDYWAPLERSLGWLQFLKILGLICWILIGMAFVLEAVFHVAWAVGQDSAAALLITVGVILVLGGYDYLMFVPLLNLWKYHNALQRAAISRQDSDLALANFRLYQLWKNLSIFLIVTLVMWLLGIIVVVVHAGVTGGLTQRLIPNLIFGDNFIFSAP